MFKLCFYCELVSFLGSQFMQDTPLQPKQIVVKTTPYCLHVPFFPAQSILHPYLTIFTSSGGATCLVILIGIIPCFVRCQPLHSCIWWYIQSTYCCAAPKVGPQASVFTKCWVCLDIFSWYWCTRSLSRVFSLLPPSRRSRIFSPACNMSFLSDAKGPQ